MINPSPSRYILYSQLVLLIAVALCVAVKPSVVFSTNQGGVSNYGTQMPTLLIFSAGVWACVWFLLAERLRVERHELKTALTLLVIGYGMLALSTYPYKLNVVFENIHIVVGFAFAFLQLALTIWLLFLNSFDKIACLSMLLMAISLVFGFLTSFQILNQLFTSQILSGIGFAIMLVHASKKLSNQE